MRLLLSHGSGSTGRLCTATWCERSQKVYASLQTIGMYGYTHCWSWQVESESMPCSQNQYRAGQTQALIAHDRQVALLSRCVNCGPSGSRYYSTLSWSKSAITPRSRPCQFGAYFGSLGMVEVAAIIMLTRSKMLWMIRLVQLACMATIAVVQ